MFRLKNFCVCFICLVLVINLLIPLEVQAVTKNEAIDFFNEFSSATNESNISKIKNYFNKYSEDGFIENFRIANIQYPKTSAYFFIARGCQEIGELENAYEYYSKAINSINSVKNADGETRGIIYKWRALCNFDIIKNSNRFDEKRLEKMFDDFETSLRNNAKDEDTFHVLGIIYYDLGEYETALQCLYKAKSLCKDYETAKEIQKLIVSVQKDIDRNKPGMIDWAKDHVGDIAQLGAVVLGLAKIGLAIFGGGGAEQYQEGY